MLIFRIYRDTNALFLILVQFEMLKFVKKITY